jgi:prefoldin subunit 5
MTREKLQKLNNIDRAIKTIEAEMDAINQMLVCDYTQLYVSTKNVKSTDEKSRIQVSVPSNIRKLILEEMLYSRERHLRELSKKFREE